METHPDVLVIGGGIIGLTSAYFLAKAGLSVEVLDKGDLGREASWAGAGIIPPGNPDRAATPIDKLRAIGSIRHASLAVELSELTGIDNGYRRCGGIEFLRPQDRDVLSIWSEEGLAFESLTRQGLRTVEPAVGECPADPYLLPGCAQVRNPWHLRALVVACERVGVRLRSHTSVRGWAGSGPRVSGVALETGEGIAAGWYLLASGAWSDYLLEPLGQRSGVHPVRGQIVLLNTGSRAVSRVLMLDKRYLVPREDGRVLIGSTEEPEAGFDKSTTAGAVGQLIGFAVRTVPALAEAAVEKAWAGLRPGSPDGLPFISPVPGHPNVLVAAGHFRAGIQLSIGTAEMVHDLITGKTPAVPVDAFRLDRTPDLTARPAFRS